MTTFSAANRGLDYDKDPNKPKIGGVIKCNDEFYKIHVVKLMSVTEMRNGVSNNTITEDGYDKILVRDSIGYFMYWLIWVDKLTRSIKFNNGIGAILCSSCSVIIKENLNKKEFKDASTIPVFCDECNSKITK